MLPVRTPTRDPPLPTIRRLAASRVHGFIGGLHSGSWHRCASGRNIANSHHRCFITAEKGEVATAKGDGEKKKECTTECKSRLFRIKHYTLGRSPTRYCRKQIVRGCIEQNSAMDLRPFWVHSEPEVMDPSSLDLLVARSDGQICKSPLYERSKGTFLSGSASDFSPVRAGPREGICGDIEHHHTLPSFHCNSGRFFLEFMHIP